MRTNRATPARGGAAGKALSADDLIMPTPSERQGGAVREVRLPADLTMPRPSGEDETEREEWILGVIGAYNYTQRTPAYTGKVPSSHVRTRYQLDTGGSF